MQEQRRPVFLTTAELSLRLLLRHLPVPQRDCLEVHELVFNAGVSQRMACHAPAMLGTAAAVASAKLGRRKTAWPPDELKS